MAGKELRTCNVTREGEESPVIRKVDKVVNRGEDITVCIPGAKLEDVVEKA